MERNAIQKIPYIIIKSTYIIRIFTCIDDEKLAVKIWESLTVESRQRLRHFMVNVIGFNLKEPRVSMSDDTYEGLRKTYKDVITFLRKYDMFRSMGYNDTVTLTLHSVGTYLLKMLKEQG